MEKNDVTKGCNERKIVDKKENFQKYILLY